MLQAIRETFPNAEIVFLSTKSNVSFLSKITVIDKVISVDDSSTWKLVTSLTKAIFQLIRNRPEIYIDLEIYSNFSSLVTISTLAKNRIGFYLSASSYRMGIYTHMMYYNTNVPISEVYMQIARVINPESKSSTLFPIYAYTKGAVPHHQIKDEKYIVMNMNASDLRIERRWAGVHFKELASQVLTNYPDKKVVFIGSGSEASYVEEVLSGFSHPNLVNLAGKTSVDELIQLIHQAELIVTNDTGPMHIAFACNTPTIALFGPCSPEQYGWNVNAKIIYKKVYCSPCVHEFITPPCNGNNSCMQLISVEEVMHEVNEFYKNGTKLQHTINYSPDQINYRNQHQDVLGVLNR